MCNMQELSLHFFELISIKLVSLMFSLHSSISLSINLFLHLQFSESKYSPKSHDLSHSYFQLLGFQIYPLSHIPSSINSLHSHRPLILYIHIVVYYYKHLHLIYIYTYMFHAILYILFH